MVLKVSQVTGRPIAAFTTAAAQPSTAQGFSVSTYELVGPDTRKSYATAGPVQDGLWSRARRFISGFDREFEALIAPAFEGRNEAVLAEFFDRKLPLILSAAARHPSAAVEMIGRMGGANLAASLLLRVACGDGAAVREFNLAVDVGRIEVTPNLVRCAARVAGIRKEEGAAILDKMFIRGNLASRVSILRTFMKGEDRDKSAVGEYFVKIMEGATKEERRDLIHPAIIGMACNAVAARNVKGGFLLAMLAGWKEEAPHEFHPEHAARLYNPLG